MSRTPTIPIATASNNIMDAKHGGDVRDSIHDAIASCYNDVTSPELNTAALETALQAKIDQGEMAALTIADGTITKAKLDPNISFETVSATVEDECLIISITDGSAT